MTYPWSTYTFIFNYEDKTEEMHKLEKQNQSTITEV